MIRDRSEYMFEEPPEDIIVNGEIMPLRKENGAGTAAKDCLRGEDLAFLIEKKQESMCAIGVNPEQNANPITDELNTNKIIRLINFSNVNGFVKLGSYWTGEEFQTESSAAGTVIGRAIALRILSGLVEEMGDGDFEMIRRNYTTFGEKPLYSSDIEALFRDYGKLVTFIPLYDKTSGPCIVTKSFSVSGETMEYDEVKQGMSVTRLRNNEILRHHIVDWSGWSDWYETSGGYRFIANIMSATVRCDFAKECKAIYLVFFTSSSDDEKYKTGKGTWNDVIGFIPESDDPDTCEWKIEMDPAEVVEKICMRHSINLFDCRASEHGQSGEQTVYIRLEGAYGLFEIRNRCRWDVK